MSHSLDVLWAEAVQAAEVACRQVISGLRAGEEAYQDLLEMNGGRSNSDVAKQLFAVGNPTAEQIQKVADLQAAMVACHQLYQAFDGSAAAAQSDRASDLRRFT